MFLVDLLSQTRRREAEVLTLECAFGHLKKKQNKKAGIFRGRGFQLVRAVTVPIIQGESPDDLHNCGSSF